MKKLITSLVFACTAALVFAGGGGDGWGIGFPVKGNGDIITSEKPVSAFNGIHVSGKTAVYYHASPEYRAVVTVDSNLNEYTSVYTENNILNIGTKNGINCIFTKYIVDVYCPGVEAVSLSGSVSFEAKDKINSSSFRVDMSGFGKIDGNFECDDFSVSISGSGDMNCNVVCSAFSADVSGDANITFSGTVNSMDISISGAGDFNGSELRANSAAVSTSGSATIRVWVLDTLKAVISGSGKVIYRGTPKIDYKSSGAGRLESV